MTLKIRRRLPPRAGCHRRHVPDYIAYLKDFDPFEHLPSGMMPLPLVHFQPAGSLSPETFAWVTFLASLQPTFLRAVILNLSTLQPAEVAADGRTRTATVAAARGMDRMDIARHYGTPQNAWRKILRGEQHEIRLLVAAQHGEVHLDPADVAGLRQHARLRLDHLRRQHAAARCHRRVLPDPLEVARQLLDRVDVADALDLDGDPAVLLVAAHEIHGPDVGRPLAAHEPEALAAPVDLLGQEQLEDRQGTRLNSSHVEISHAV